MDAPESDLLPLAIRADRSRPSRRKTTVKTHPIVALLLIIAALQAGSLSAQSSGDVHPWLEDDFIISLGSFLPSKEFKIRVDGQVPGRNIDFGESAGLSEDDVSASLLFRWKFSEKWSVTGQYWGTENDGEAVLTENVTWGENVLRAGSNVGAGVSADVFRLFFGRELFTDADHHEFGFGAGLHWLQIKAYMDGEFFVNDQSTGFRREQVNADLPLPNIGAWYWYSLSPRWLLTTHLDWFSASIDEYSGSLWDAGAGINFQALEHLGFGLTYRYFKIDVDVDKSNWNGKADLTHEGPFLSATFNW